jgi:hypothetical protein
MSKTTTVDVYCRLEHGVIIGEEAFGIGGDSGMAMDSARVVLEHGFNENIPREQIEAWLARNKNLACVKRGDIRIVDGDRLARDSRK